MARWSTTRCSATTPTRSRSRRWSASTRSAPTGSPTASPCATGSSSMTARRSPPRTSIASLKRWGAKDGVGQRLMGYVTEMKAVDDKTFTMVLREPYGMVLESLGKNGSSIAAIMREKDALTDPQQQVKEFDRLRSVRLRQGPVGAGQQGGLPQEQGLRAAPGNEPPSSFAGGQDARRRSHRADLDLRSADGDVGAGQRRDRLLREPQHRLPADPGEGQGREAA